MCIIKTRYFTPLKIIGITNNDRYNKFCEVRLKSEDDEDVRELI